MSFFKFVTEFADGLQMGRDFRALLENREVGMANLEAQVNAMTPEQLVNFEENFMRLGVLAVEPKVRMRAMEMYAWFKIKETDRCGGFCGFLTANLLSDIT